MTMSSHLFVDGDVVLAAHVHRAADDPLVPQPTVIVMGSWLTVKEQMADLYAAALAERGYTAITFDFAGFGASGGTLRQTEMPARKIANLKAAVDWASSLSFVQPGGLGVLAVCASAQYTLAAMAGGLPLRSFASVAGWFHDAASIATFYGGAEGVQDRLSRAATAADDYQPGSPLHTVAAYAPGDDSAGMFVEMDYYADPARGAVSSWTNEMTELSWAHWLTFDGVSPAAKVDVPSLFVHSDGCVFPDNVSTVMAALQGPVERAWGVGDQIDFYDRPTQVRFALDAVDTHFRATLGQPA